MKHLQTDLQYKYTEDYDNNNLDCLVAQWLERIKTCQVQGFKPPVSQ